MVMNATTIPLRIVICNIVIADLAKAELPFGFETLPGRMSASQRTMVLKQRDWCMGFDMGL